jgi:hypothetical protein
MADYPNFHRHLLLLLSLNFYLIFSVAPKHGDPTAADAHKKNPQGVGGKSIHRPLFIERTPFFRSGFDAEPRICSLQ